MHRLLWGQALAELAREAMQPVLEVQQLWLGLSAPRELQDVLDDQIHAPRVVLNDLRQATVRAVQLLGLLKQLCGMADGAQRVAYLVGNAGGESSERCELELLRFLRNLRDVLEKDQGVELVAMLQGGEARLERRATRRCLEILRAQGGIAAPLLQGFEQLRAARGKTLAGQRFVLAE